MIPFACIARTWGTVSKWTHHLITLGAILGALLVLGGVVVVSLRAAWGVE